MEWRWFLSWDKKTKKCKVKKEAPMVFRITLVQGLNRQIRRM